MALLSGLFSINVTDEIAGKRLDNVLALGLSECSRSMAALLIRDGKIFVDGKVKKSSYKVKTGEIVSGDIPSAESISYDPEPIVLSVIYEDDHLLVINKPAGMVVHPAPGHSSGTIVNAILHHCPDLEGINCKIRPGIVHRLDKDTSGVLVVAKTSSAHTHLCSQFKERTIDKTYVVLVSGKMKTLTGTVDLPIGRHPVDRKKMSVQSTRTRDAKTVWLVKEMFDSHSLLEVKIKTGRTHQIRVHLAAIHHPVVGDEVYGPKKSQISAGNNFSDILKIVKRQMLHAWRLSFTHPVTHKLLDFEAPIPEDMAIILNEFRMMKLQTLMNS